MVPNMRAMWSKTLAGAVVTILAFGAIGEADARQEKQRSLITRDSDRGISIMRDEHAPKAKGRSKAAAGPRKAIRGSSTYIPPPIPSRSSGRATVTLASPGVYKPPPITSFGDRATDAIHSYPLQKGIGNNSTDQQMYIRQRSN